jgi:hypothetical protein
VHLLFDLAYRIVAIASCLYCGRTVWYGLVERRITAFNTDILDWWTPRQVLHRDAAPVPYWILICTQAVTTVLCFVAAIVGWWQPNA